MTSQSSSSKSNKSDDEINVKKEDTGSSNKQRFSHVYQYFTWNELTSRWNCFYCE